MNSLNVQTTKCFRFGIFDNNKKLTFWHVNFSFDTTVINKNNEVITKINKRSIVSISHIKIGKKIDSVNGGIKRKFKVLHHYQLSDMVEVDLDNGSTELAKIEKFTVSRKKTNPLLVTLMWYNKKGKPLYQNKPVSVLCLNGTIAIK